MRGPAPSASDPGRIGYRQTGRRPDVVRRSDVCHSRMVVEPMLATSGPLPTDEERWAFEPKWDGFRAIVHRDGRRLRILSRWGTDLTGRLPELAPLAGALPADTTLDGELVVVDPEGRVDF